MSEKERKRRRLQSRRATMAQLDKSLNFVKRLENSGRLTKFRIGARDVSHDCDEVELIARGER